MEAINLGIADGLPVMEWAAVAAKLNSGQAPQREDHNSKSTWLSTVNEDGSTHLTPVGALWFDGAYWFQTGVATRKARNVARDPRCSIAVSLHEADIVASTSSDEFAAARSSTCLEPDVDSRS